MKFIITVRWKDGSKSWEETYDEPHVKSIEDAQRVSENMIAHFNNTLRPLEKPREIIKVALSGQSENHKWYKASLATISDQRLGLYDAMQCESCGVTGKRFNLNRNIKIDSKFRAKKYQTCDQQ